jgi:hypothetical protein
MKTVAEIVTASNEVFWTWIPRAVVSIALSFPSNQATSTVGLPGATAGK